MAYTTIDNPELYFQTKLYAGNGSSQSITFDGSENMQPDWVWVKSRSNTTNHSVYDIIRGVQQELRPNSTDAEATRSTGLTSFDSDGFSAGNNININNSGYTYASWNWKAGTSASGNTTGSGTAQSYTASASTTAGFSITAFTGNGTANHTLPHNLGVAPDWFIIKKRIGTGDSTVRDWNVYHKSLGNTKRIALNSNGAVSTSSEYWNDTSPTSSVINLGTNDQINGNNNTYICYAFAEKKGYSKFGSYTGNGNADGTFVYTGFKPAWIMFKESDGSASGDNWFMFDNKRSTFNQTQKFLKANTNDAETDNSAGAIDILSNGWKLRTNDTSLNQNNSTYIYMAFAESPLVNSNGVPNNAR